MKIEVKNIYQQKKEYFITNEYQEITVEYGDFIFVYENKNSVNFYIKDDDLKLSFLNHKKVVLKNFIKLIQENHTQEIAPQFNDLSLLDKFITKLEFTKSSLFDEEFCIKDINTLNKVIENGQTNQKMNTVLYKSIKFQTKKQDNIKIEEEEFECYRADNFQIFIHN